MKIKILSVGKTINERSIVEFEKLKSPHVYVYENFISAFVACSYCSELLNGLWYAKDSKSKIKGSACSKCVVRKGWLTKEEVDYIRTLAELSD